ATSGNAPAPAAGPANHPVEHAPDERIADGVKGLGNKKSMPWPAASRSRRHPRLYTNPADLAKSTAHVTAVHELTSKSKFAKRAIFFCKLAFLAKLARRHATRCHLARTDIGCPRSRANECPL